MTGNEGRTHLMKKKNRRTFIKKKSVYNMTSCVHTLHTCVNVNKYVWDAHHGYLQAEAVLCSFSLLCHIDWDFIIIRIC